MARRPFRHLNKSEIQEIVVCHNDGETQAALAKRFNVDHSTIHYHLDQYRRTYPEQGSVYSLIQVKVRKACVHPSSKCTMCGEMMDHLLREERDLVRTLTERLAKANSMLRVSGLPVY